MNITKEEAHELIAMPKKLIKNDMPYDSYTIELHDHVKERYDLHSIDGNMIFMMQIAQHFNQFKISLHFQESDRHIQLYRLDFHSPHKNPEKCNQFVPDILRPYTGKRLEVNHVHLFVESYPPLAWALPLADYDFQTKEISNGNSLADAIEEFCAKINITTKITCERRLFL